MNTQGGQPLRPRDWPSTAQLNFFLFSALLLQSRSAKNPPIEVAVFSCRLVLESLVSSVLDYSWILFFKHFV